jgi:2'-5' RNA ligase
MKTFSEIIAEGFKQPLYVAVDPDEATKKILTRIQNTYDVPHAYTPDKMHCTLIYSNKPCSLPQMNPKTVYRAEFDRFDFFDQRNGKRCLFMKLKSPELQARHGSLMKEMKASYDFPDYLPHITLSYDCGKYDASMIKWPTGVPIFFSNETCTPHSDE